MARDRRKDEKYVNCVEAIIEGGSPKELKEEDPSHPFVELTAELVSRKKGDSMGLWKHLCLEDTSEGHLIFLDSRLVPPCPAIDKVLRSIHQSHMSPSTLIKNVDTHYFWPGMAGDVRKKAESCQACRMYKKSNSKTKGIVPLELQEFLPGEAWSCNVLSYKGKDYLVAFCMVSSFV